MLTIQLTETGKEREAREHRFSAKRFLIGRHASCHLTVNHKTVSRQHCVILRNGRQLLVTDLGSRAKTLVNGVDVSVGETAVLQHGDVLRLGDCEFRVTILDCETGEPSYCEPEYLRELPFPFVNLPNRVENGTVKDEAEVAETTPTRSDSEADTSIAGDTMTSANDLTRHGKHEKSAMQRYLDAAGTKSAAQEALQKMFPGKGDR